ncbi:hypothetical protein EIN_096130 [Entamoeba invadens IP1]|uniref:Transcription factor TFIIIB component B'' Myb domain-containing protein n=1 Tax=Entamoeba invadens IP1 TaxID=370355 RepID=A0A0A1U699_ENTIV|nr:hypothetical protein EIN_096130 [Entamoeba invadens IP1]ELP87356.1 hypothetical protein EIN_096130 [Entamoeba invadens IP1]|eukprot:XP_004254127.1 hypothetical protein EIN_096130 [Entamoeba invadens IP1]
MSFYSRYLKDEVCVGTIDGVEEAKTPNTYNRKPHWRREDILKFYEGLTLYGANFALLELFFNGTRTHKQLLARFKLEQKMRPELVSKAMLPQVVHLDKVVDKN